MSREAMVIFEKELGPDHLDMAAAYNKCEFWPHF